MPLFSLQFVPASSQFLQLASAVGGNLTELTFAGWVKTTSAATIGGDCALAAFGFSTNPAGTSFGVDGGKATYKYYNGGFHIFKGATPVNDGAWHQIAVTHDGSGNVTIYVDNVVDGTGSIAWTSANGTKLDVLGAHNGGIYFDGQLSDCYYYDRALTSGEIGQLYTFNDPSSANLLGKYLFLEGSPATTTADGSGNANTATLTNGPTWVSGDHPELGFPAQLHVIANPTVRNDLTLTLSMSWLSGVQGPATVWTPTLDDPTVGTFSPASATLAATSGAIASIGLTITGAAAPGAHTITWANNQGLPAHRTTFSIVVPTASLTAARISPGGNWLRLEGSAPFTGYAGGATLTVNGTPIALVNPLFDSTNANMMFTLNRRYEAIVGSGAATAAGAGTFTPVTNLNRGIWYLDVMHTSPDPGATAVYDFPDALPGTYMLQSIDPIDPAHTTHAQLNVNDGVSLNHNFAVDQTASGSINSTAGEFDDCDSFYDWTNRGIVVAAGPFTVTLSKTVDDGQLLAASGVRIKRLTSSMVGGVPIVASGDTVVLNFPDSCITCAGGTTIGHTPTTVNPLGFSGSVPNTKREWYSYTEGMHAFKPGFNMSRFDPDEPSRLAANWRLGADVWGGPGTHGFGVDAEGNLNSMAPDGMVRCRFAGTGLPGPHANGDDWKGNPIWPRSGNATVQYTNTPPVNFTLTLLDDFGVSGSVGMTSTPTTVVEGGITKQRVTIPYTAPADLAAYSTGLTLQVTSTGSSNNFPTDVEIRDPSMDGVSWDKFVHKATYDRIVPYGFNGPLRFMDILGTNCSGLGSYADLDHPNQHSGFTLKQLLIPVASIEPVDLTMADADQALHYFGNFATSGSRAVVKVRLATGHTCTSLGIKSGMIVLADSSFVPGYNPFEAGQDQPSWSSTWSGGGTEPGIYLENFSFAAVTGAESDTVFIMTCRAGGLDPQGTQLTLAGIQTVSGNLTCNRQPTPSITWIVQCCNDLGMDLYFNIPHIWSPSDDPASFTDLATYIATHLDSRLKCHFEGTNELFSLVSPGAQQGYWFKSLQQQNSLGGGGGIAGPYTAYAQWVGQWTPLVRAAFATAGRASDCKIVLGSFLNDLTETIAVLDQWYLEYPDPVAGPNFDYLAVSLYPENATNWTLDISYAINNTDAQGLVELANVTIIKNPGTIGAIDGHVSLLAGYGGRFTGVQMCLYEYAFEIMSGGGNGFAPTESHSVAWHPDAYHLTLAFLEAINAHGVAFGCYFGLDLAGGQANGSNWQQYRSNSQPAGNGTEPVGNPFNQLTAPSHVAGAYQAFALGAMPICTWGDAPWASRTWAEGAPATGTILPVLMNTYRRRRAG